MPERALVIIDVQNDFLPGGALAVPQGDEVIEVVNRCQPLFELVVATQDWHPTDHVSFASNHPGRRPGDVIEIDGQKQVLWPPHCVEHSRGAALADRLDTRRIAHIVYKGTDPRIDSYSAFFYNAHRRATGLGDFLRARAVDEVFLLGLATDYCVMYSALDALQEGFATAVITDGCRGIDLHPGDVDAALSKMRERGVRLVDSTELPGCSAR